MDQTEDIFENDQECFITWWGGTVEQGGTCTDAKYKAEAGCEIQCVADIPQKCPSLFRESVRCIVGTERGGWSGNFFSGRLTDGRYLFVRLSYSPRSTIILIAPHVGPPLDMPRLTPRKGTLNHLLAMAQAKSAAEKQHHADSLLPGCVLWVRPGWYPETISEFLKEMPFA